MSDWEEDDNPSNSISSNSKWKPNRQSDAFGRNSDRGQGSRRNGKFVSNYNYTDSIDIKKECIGKIIGRAGSNIQRLQTKYGVRIDLDSSRNIVTVFGNSEVNVKNALDNIRNQMERYEGNVYSDSNKVGSSNHTDSGDREGTSYDNNEEFTVIDWQALYAKSDAIAKERWANFPPLTKDFYQEDPEVAALSTADVERIRLENNNTSVERVFSQNDGVCENVPNPIWKFEQCFGAYSDLMAEIKKQNFQKPSPIQAQAWPILLKGNDMVGIAQTGTGKTLAFLLPAMIHTEYQNIPRSERKGPNVLVIAPTRELALQIEKEVNKYRFRGMKAVCVYGGGSRRDQIDSVESGVEIIICTPGRLNDLIQAKVVNVTTVTYLVLDEADRMLDMGFEPQIQKILLDIRPDRQTVMTSATWPPGVRRLAEKYMNNPIQVCVGSLDLAATHTVQQIIEIVEEDDKYNTVRAFLKKMKPNDKVIIFCGRKVRADDLSSDLTLEGFNCQSLHGSREQSDREQALSYIKSGTINILIATDLASRGLDIEDITYVINFDFPRNIEEYVHRVGRTGRAGRTGTSISYITRSDWAVAAELIGILEEANQHVPEELRDMAERFAKMKERKTYERGSGGGRGGRRYHY